jgi:pseudouridine kinase
MRRRPRILCLGGAVIDRKLQAFQLIRPGTSNPARGTLGFGGVARNVAENLARLGAEVRFASCVGDDPAGSALVDHLAALGVDVGSVRTVKGAATAEYIALLQPDGSLHVAAADMAILDRIYGPLVDEAMASARHADWLFADCNAPAEVLASLAGQARESGIRLALDVISVPKAMRLPLDLTGVACLFLNRDEATALLGGQGDAKAASGEPAALAAALRARGAATVVLTLGADGCMADDGAGPVHVVAAPTAVVDVTGAGDAMIAATLLALGHGLPLAGAVHFGTIIAARTVASPLSVDDTLSPALVDAFLSGETSGPPLLPSAEGPRP